MVTIQQPLPAGRARQLVASGEVGRLVFTRGALPAVLPVRYHLEQDLLVLEPAGEADWVPRVAQTVVAFQVDRLSGPERLDWSVVVTGVAAPHGNSVALDLTASVLSGSEHAVGAVS
jgi:hypothetical protein